MEIHFKENPKSGGKPEIEIKFIIKINLELKYELIKKNWLIK